MEFLFFKVPVRRIVHINLIMYLLSVPKITASAQVYRKPILKQMQYRFAVNFGTLSIPDSNSFQYYSRACARAL